MAAVVKSNPNDQKNPYLDNSLMNNDFSADKNKQFEKIHIVPSTTKPQNDDPTNDAQQKTTKYITFKWNPSIKEKNDCDTKHMLYLIQKSLDNVKERIKQRNDYFRSLGRNDRIMTPLDRKKVLTALIANCNKPNANGKYFEIDGKLFETTTSASGKKDFINNILAKKGDITMGWATQIYIQLEKLRIHNEISTEEQSGKDPIKIENYKYERLLTDGAIMIDCDINQFKEITKKCLITSNNINNKLKKDDVINFLNDKKMDGKMFMDLGTKKFAQQFADFMNNKKFKGPANKLGKQIKSFDITKL